MKFVTATVLCARYMRISQTMPSRSMKRSISKRLKYSEALFIESRFSHIASSLSDLPHVGPAWSRGRDPVRKKKLGYRQLVNLYSATLI